MKFNITFLILLLTGIVNVLSALPIDTNNAKKAATQFLLSQSSLRELPIDQAHVSLAHTAYSESSSNNVALFYAFNFNDSGFILISADDCVSPVIGYSSNGPFMMNQLPDNFVYYIHQYGLQIQEAISTGITASASIAEEWDNLLNSSGSTRHHPTRQVAPLLTTTWDQLAQYNTLCPEDSTATSGHVPAGCVSVAMAQILKFWQYPSSGIGEHEYEADNADEGYGNYGLQYADFENAIYDYSYMPNQLFDYSTPNQINEIATLIYHCGVAVEMQYGPIASGATSYGSGYSALNSLNHIFGYSNIELIHRFDFSNAEWINQLKAQLDFGFPIYYSASGSSGGHAFICDGYDENNFFHFNWGWSGVADGFFSVNSLTPASFEFNDLHTALINIYPPEQYSASHEQLNFYTPFNTTSSAKKVSFTCFQNASPITATVSSPFSISQDSVNWSSSVTLSPSGGDVWVRFYAPAAISFNEELIISNDIRTLDTIALIGMTCNYISTFPFTQNFEGMLFPASCWSLFDGAADNSSWTRIDNASADAHSGSRYVCSSTSSAEGLHPDNYLVTPALVIPEQGALLHFWIAAANPFANENQYAIQISSSLDLQNFVTIYEETISTTNWQERTIPLHHFGGDTVHIAFVHYLGDSSSTLKLDDISLTPIIPIDSVDLSLTIVQANAPHSPINTLQINNNDSLFLSFIIENHNITTPYIDSSLSVTVTINNASISSFNISIGTLLNNVDYFFISPLLLSSQQISEQYPTGNYSISMHVTPSYRWIEQDWSQNDDTVTLSITNTAPSLWCSDTAFTFTSGVIQPSTIEEIEIDAVNQNSMITAHCTLPFEISTNQNNWDTIAYIGQTGGSVYVRYHPTSCQNHEGTLWITGSASTHIIALYGKTPSFLIASTHDVNGNIFADGDIPVCYGDIQLFTIVPDLGYGINEVWVDGINLGNISYYSFSNVTEHHTIHADFYLIPVPRILTNTDTLVFEARLGTSSLPSVVNVFGFDLNQAITALSSQPFEISIDAVNWTHTLSLSQNGGAVFVRFNPQFSGTVNGILEFRNAESPSAIITLIGSTTSYSITAYASSGGTIEPAGESIVQHGSSLSLVATPDSTFALIDLLIDGESIGPVSEYTFNNVVENHFVYALFAHETGIDDNELSMTLYPNPTTCFVTIKDNNHHFPIRYEIFDQYGKLLYTGTAADHHSSIDLGDYASGIYFIRFATGDKIKMMKVIRY